MSVGVESAEASPFAFQAEVQRQKSSIESSLQLPNVFVTPPEEEYDSPPWCCFDADKDAQPGEFMYEDTENQDFDYAAHAEDEIFGGEATHTIAGNEERDDVFVMRSLMQEAEHLREKLKSLDLSAGPFPFTAPLPAEDEELCDDFMATPTSASFSAVQPEQQVKRRKSLFSFKTLGRKKSFEDNTSRILPVSASENDLGSQITSNRDVEVASVRSSTSRKFGFFSRFKFSSRKSAPGLAIDGPDGRKSMSACRSHEELPSMQEPDVDLKRRFSIFDLSRRSFSAAPSIVPSMNQSTSSLSTSSVPPTPDAAMCALASPPDSPTEKSNDRTPSVESSFLSTMDVHAVNNIAASLILPTSHSIASDGQFSLDPLHFESLQFDSDDFP